MRIGVDCDGVICVTPFGRLAVHAPGGVPNLPPRYEDLYASEPPGGALRLAVEGLRFGWRRIARDAPAMMRDIASAGHELHIITGRSSAGAPLLRAWLRRRGVDASVTAVHMAPPGLRPAQHKLAVARRLRIEAHLDDDPRTAHYLARNGVARVFLYDHAGAHGDDTPPENLTVVRSLGEFARAITTGDASGGGARA